MDARLICVVGGGISGLVFAALHRANGGEAVVLERETIADNEDGKSVVIGAASLATLQKAGATISNAATLLQARVSFQNAPGGITIEKSDLLGCGIAHREVRAQLAKSLGDSFVAPVAVSSIVSEKNFVRVLYRAAKDEEKEITAAGAVVACALPALPPPFAARTFDFRQAVVSFAAEARNFPAGLAVESFTRLGIVALVPRTDKKIGVILCADSAKAGALSVLADDSLLAEINDCFGGEFGLYNAGEKFIYAPQTRRAYPLSAGNVALAGAGATILHPAGAQGLNLGIGDGECLAKLLQQKNNVAAAFAEYRRRRAPMHCAMLAATGILAAGGHLRFAPFRFLGGATTGLLATLLPFCKPVRDSRT